MPSFPFSQVDAFTRRPLGGNPCAVVFDADSLNTQQMQAIAQEQNLSETAFVLCSNVADIRARYFTPRSEIPLAGHPTIATIFALVESGRISVFGRRRALSLELAAGVISVEVVSEGGKPVRVVMTQLRPQFLAKLSAAEVCPVFGLDPVMLHPDVPVEVVSTGTAQLMICVRSVDALRTLDVRYRDLATLGERAGFFSAHLFYINVDGSRTFARHFAPEFEDPFTGSATGGMGAFLWHHGLTAHSRFLAEQGTWMGRKGVASVEVLGPPDDISGVKVGGNAVTVIRGTLTI